MNFESVESGENHLTTAINYIRDNSKEKENEHITNDIESTSETLGLLEVFSNDPLSSLFADNRNEQDILPAFEHENAMTNNQNGMYISLFIKNDVSLIDLVFTNEQNEQGVLSAYENEIEMVHNLDGVYNSPFIKNDFPLIDLAFGNGQGKKRTIEEDNESTDEAHNEHEQEHEYEHQFFELKKQYVFLKKENEYYRTHWMRK